ncbi:MAG TPA: phage BR0599 family protein [Methylomirabilota bacterium]|nr:phage BR0599 family protein [Methylomirabilota bacterium]
MLHFALISHWKLNEASGTRADSHGANPLSAGAGGVSSGPGKIGNAARMAGTELFSNSDFHATSSFAIAGWVKFDDATVGTVAGYGVAAGGFREWAVEFNGVNLTFSLSANGSTWAATLTSGIAIKPGRWHFFAAWWDHAAKVMYLSVDAEAPVYLSYTGSIANAAASFRLGKGDAAPLGYIDSVSFFRRTLTTADVDALWNSGAGRDYPLQADASGTVNNGHVILPHLPDWSFPVEWSREWQTVVNGTVAGGEARASMRQRPLLRLKYTVSAFSHRESAILEDHLRAALLAQKAAVPYWGRGQKLAADVTSTTVTLEPTPYAPAPGDWLFFGDALAGETDEWDVRQIVAVVGGAITLDSPVSRTYLAGQLCWPMLFGSVTAEQVPLVSSHHGRYTIRFEENVATSLTGVGGATGAGGGAITAWQGTPVFLFPANWVTDPTHALDFDSRPHQIGFGERRFTPTVTQLDRAWQLMCELPTEAQIEEFDYFMRQIKGRWGACYLPDLLERVQVVQWNSDTEIEITDQNFDHEGGGDTYLAFIKAGQAPQFAGVSASLDLGNGRERLTLAHSISAVDETWQVFYLYKVRLADDEERGSFVAEGWQQRQLKFVRPASPNSITQSQPVWLYHFWINTPTPVHWRFTSFERDFASGGWLHKPRPISHGDIRRTIRADREEVTIETLFDGDNPLKLFLPVPPSYVLNLEIHEDTAAGGARELRYTGIVREPRFEGRRITATCASIVSELDRKVPGHLFQPRCNYTLFHPNCGLSKAAYQVNATINSYTAGAVSVVVDVGGFTPPTDPIDYFSKGELQRGDETQFESRTILRATKGSGSLWTLDLPLPLAYATVGESVKIWPGCDGLLATCDDKFDNVANFGGFPYMPIKNLTLSAAKSKQTGGKK